jgi:hypothetical protein
MSGQQSLSDLARKIIAQRLADTQTGIGQGAGFPPLPGTTAEETLAAFQELEKAGLMTKMGSSSTGGSVPQRIYQLTEDAKKRRDEFLR